MITRLALLSSSLLQHLAQLIARIPPSLWLKLAVVVALVLVKQGALQ